jgi:DNA-binding Lrp family transcriptional regulator
MIRTNIDETDLALLHALQIAPRAPWDAVGKALGISSSTAARRWQRLTRRGDAWVTSYAVDPPQTCGAMVEVKCDANRVQEAVDAISADPHAMSVEVTAGGRDLLLAVRVRSVDMLSRYLARLQRVPGVRSISSNVITESFSDAGRWRLDALDGAQQFTLRNGEEPRSAAPTEFAALDRRLAVALSEDGRMPLSELAERLGVSVNTIRRRLARLIAGDALRFRCDVARPVSGYDIAATFWVDVAPLALVKSARALAALPRTRVVVSVAGPQNLILMAWLRSPADIPVFESELAIQAPESRVVDRTVTLRVVKQMGRLLDDTGRAGRVIPMDPWADSEASS